MLFEEKNRAHPKPGPSREQSPFVWFRGKSKENNERFI
jgi:hypothetical protein